MPFRTSMFSGVRVASAFRPTTPATRIWAAGLHHSAFFSSNMIQTGSTLPSVTLQHDGSPANTVDALDYFRQFNKAVLIGVPGAFTPGCSKSHVPSYLEASARLHKEKGVDAIACVSVNDAFVMDAWAKDQLANTAEVDGKPAMEFLADPRAEFVKAMGLDFDATGVLGSVRSKRFVMILEKGVVKHVQVEPDFTGLTCTLAKDVAPLLD
ncbi:Peroxiredoxin-5, mitochondrial [Tieghemiomyces parasiticus]|uniref:Peroxiredoxin-5, mitochondrial n=1 Tax=Tieghemiomyces parasiticus TaxID=78921 RepID=A0A9W7ZR17_9FUNG|nr:Peroxiredoxin-5, mitochondrial [Tieghemiomyces parasiticus]